MKTLIVPVLLILCCCQFQQKQDSSKSDESEIEHRQDSPAIKELDPERKQRFVIQQGRVGEIKTGDWIKDISIPSLLELTKSGQTRPTEEGNVTEPIYILSESGVELLKITCAFNTTTSKWDEKVGEINITNPAFKTVKGIGANSTVGEFMRAYQDAKFFYSYVSNRFWCATGSLEDTQFELDPSAFTGDKKDVFGELTEIEPKFFWLEGRIIRVRLY